MDISYGIYSIENLSVIGGVGKREVGANYYFTMTNVCWLGPKFVAPIEEFFSMAKNERMENLFVSDVTEPLALSQMIVLVDTAEDDDPVVAVGMTTLFVLRCNAHEVHEPS
jgi:hypothetical protein